MSVYLVGFLGVLASLTTGIDPLPDSLTILLPVDSVPYCLTVYDLCLPLTSLWISFVYQF